MRRRLNVSRRKPTTREDVVRFRDRGIQDLVKEEGVTVHIISETWNETEHKIELDVVFETVDKGF